MNRAVDAYLAELEARRCSHSRRHHAARTLERLLIYMREAHSITDWRGVNESQLRDFALYAATRHRTPRGKRISAATLRQWLSILRSFFVWLNRNGHLLHNPAERLAFPHKEQSLPHVLNESEVARLIETPDITTTIDLRDRALLEVLYATGTVKRTNSISMTLIQPYINSLFALAKAGAIGLCRLLKPPLTGLLVTSPLPVQSSPTANSGAKVNAAASPKSFRQLPLSGSPLPAVVSPIK